MSELYKINESGHIINTEGWVLVRYYQPIQKMITVGKNSYVFVPRYNLSCCWIRPDDVAGVLEIRGGCCGGSRQVFFLVNEANARLWFGFER